MHPVQRHESVIIGRLGFVMLDAMTKDVSHGTLPLRVFIILVDYPPCIL